MGEGGSGTLQDGGHLKHGHENSAPQYVAEEAPFFMSIPTPPSSGGEFPMSNSILFLPLLNTTGSCCFLHLPWIGRGTENLICSYLYSFKKP